MRFFIFKVMDKKNILKKINSANKDTLMETLDIEFIDIGEDFLVAKMPVTSKVYQPDGVLHGGATVALAESVGSAVSYMSVDYINQTVRGIIISANLFVAPMIFVGRTALSVDIITKEWTLYLTATLAKL